MCILDLNHSNKFLIQKKKTQNEEHSAQRQYEDYTF